MMNLAHALQMRGFLKLSWMSIPLTHTPTASFEPTSLIVSTGMICPDFVKIRNPVAGDLVET
jgi:hypothetical protein